MELESRLYHKYANIFELGISEGKLYEVNEPLTAEGKKDTVYFKGRYYTHQKTKDSQELTPNLPLIKSMLTKVLFQTLRANGYFTRKDVVFRNSDKVNQPNGDIFEIFQGFKLKTLSFFDRLFICVDPHLVISTQANVSQLLAKGIPKERLSGFSVRYKKETDFFVDGFLIGLAENGTSVTETCMCQIKNYRNFTEDRVNASLVFPESRPEVLQSLLDSLGRRFNLVSIQRQYSFLNSKTASIDRLKKTLEIVKQLNRLFPLKFGSYAVSLEVDPTRVKW